MQFPLKGGRSTSDIFKYLLDIMFMKLTFWKTRMRNMEEIVCLVKSVMASILSYAVQVFWLPIGLLKKLNQAIRSFIWEKDRGNRG